MNSGGKHIRVLLIDDHSLFRRALRSLLEEEDGIEFAGEAGDAQRGIELATRTQPDVVLLDIGMQGVGGIQAAHVLQKRTPRCKVVILSQYDDEEYVLESLGDAGAAGYLLKSDAAQELFSAIHAVTSGKRYISPSVAPVILERLSGRFGTHGKTTLTRREEQILKLVAEGASSKVIAKDLGISPKTVQVHRTNLAAKLHLGSTAALVRYAVKHKLVKLD